MKKYVSRKPHSRSGEPTGTMSGMQPKSTMVAAPKSRPALTAVRVPIASMIRGVTSDVSAMPKGYEAKMAPFIVGEIFQLVARGEKKAERKVAIAYREIKTTYAATSSTWRGTFFDDGALPGSSGLSFPDDIVKFGEPRDAKAS